MRGKDGIITSPSLKPSPGFAAINRTLWSYVEGRISAIVEEHGDKHLVIDGATDEKYTYATFGSQVKKIAGIFYHRYGVRKGSVVIICSNNTLNLFVAFYGAAALGAVIFAIPAYSHDNIPSCLREEQHVPIILCDENVLEHVTGYLNSPCDEAGLNAEMPKIILLRGEKLGVDDVSSLLSSQDEDHLPDVDFPILDESEEAVVFFSSGSTGPPKPISHNHRNLLSITYNVCKFWTEEEANDVVLFHMNHAHVGGFMFFLGTIAARSTIVTFSDFSTDILLRALQRYRPSIITFYPKDAIALSKVQGCDELDFGFVKEILAGAAMFPSSIISTLKKIFNNLQHPIGQIYGSTEVFLVANTAATNDAPESGTGVGHLLPYVEMKIVDIRSGQALGPNENGEIFFRTPFRMMGYRNRPDLTAVAITEDGWYKSGDYGFYDDEERLHLVERIKDLMLLPSGKLVSPSAIENVILSHNDVVQVGVSGIRPPSEGKDLKDVMGTLTRAFVVKRPGSKLKAEDVVDFVTQQTENPEFQLTGGAELVESLVLSPGGKVYRLKLKKDYENRLAVHS